MDSKYHKTGDGEEFIIEMGDTLYLACCDCGLVHKGITAENTDTEEIAIIFFRDERRTAQLRRYSYGSLQKNRNKKWKLIRRGM